MKSKSFVFLVLSVFIFSCQKGTPTKTETFKVWGNCEKCKKTIETSCSVDGVKEKNWNVDSKLLTVTFDTTVITLNAIQELIAKSGYDNDAFYANDYAYNKLENCCQYERKPVELP